MKFDALDIVGRTFVSNHDEQYTVKKYLGNVNKIHKYIIVFDKTKNEKEYPRATIKAGNVCDVWQKEKIKEVKAKALVTREKTMNSVDESGLNNGKMNKDSVTLVLDQATKNCGYCIFENKKLQKYGTIKSTYDNIGDRILEIEKNVEQLIAKYSVKNIVLEDIYLDKNLVVFKYLAFLLGVLINCATRNRLKYSTVNILAWKRKYKLEKLGSRDLGKNYSKQIVLEQIGISVTNDDVSDAILIGYYFLGEEIGEQKEGEEYNW